MLRYVLLALQNSVQGPVKILWEFLQLFLFSGGFFPRTFIVFPVLFNSPLADLSIIVCKKIPPERRKRLQKFALNIKLLYITWPRTVLKILLNEDLLCFNLTFKCYITELRTGFVQRPFQECLTA